MDKHSYRMIALLGLLATSVGCSQQAPTSSPQPATVETSAAQASLPESLALPPDLQLPAKLRPDQIVKLPMDKVMDFPASSDRQIQQRGGRGFGGRGGRGWGGRGWGGRGWGGRGWGGWGGWGGGLGYYYASPYYYPYYSYGGYYYPYYNYASSYYNYPFLYPYAGNYYPYTAALSAPIVTRPFAGGIY